MQLDDVFAISSAVLASLGGGAIIVFAMSRWLGGVWAGRILENERALLAREHELLVRRRNVYTQLVLSMRIFLESNKAGTPEQQESFLAAYDEAALWASEPVINALSIFIDTLVIFKQDPSIASQQDVMVKFVTCITEMRKDCGFPMTEYRHRMVTF